MAWFELYNSWSISQTKEIKKTSWALFLFLDGGSDETRTRDLCRDRAAL